MWRELRSPLRLGEHSRMNTHTHTHTHQHTHTHTHTHTHIHTGTKGQLWRHMSVSQRSDSISDHTDSSSQEHKTLLSFTACKHTHAHTHTCTRAHTQTHTHIYTCLQAHSR